MHVELSCRNIGTRAEFVGFNPFIAVYGNSLHVPLSSSSRSNSRTRDLASTDSNKTNLVPVETARGGKYLGSVTQYFGRTEVQENRRSPEYQNPVAICYETGEDMLLTFKLFDCPDGNADQLLRQLNHLDPPKCDNQSPPHLLELKLKLSEFMKRVASNQHELDFVFALPSGRILPRHRPDDLTAAVLTLQMATGQLATPRRRPGERQSPDPQHGLSLGRALDESPRDSRHSSYGGKGLGHAISFNVSNQSERSSATPTPRRPLSPATGDESLTITFVCKGMLCTRGLLVAWLVFYFVSLAYFSHVCVVQCNIFGDQVYRATFHQ